MALSRNSALVTVALALLAAPGASIAQFVEAPPTASLIPPPMQQPSTDYRCLSDCTGSGLSYMSCKPQCSYYEMTPITAKTVPGAPPPPATHTDYACLKSCVTDNHYGYSYCEYHCTTLAP